MNIDSIKHINLELSESNDVDQTKISALNSPHSPPIMQGIFQSHFENLGKVFIEIESFKNDQKLEFKGSLQLKIGKDRNGPFVNKPTGILKARDVSIHTGSAINEGLITSTNGPIQIHSTLNQTHKNGLIHSADEILLKSTNGSLWFQKNRLITPNKKILLASDFAYTLEKGKPITGIRDQGSVWQCGLLEVRTTASPIHLYSTHITSGLLLVSGSNAKIQALYLNISNGSLSEKVIIQSKNDLTVRKSKFYKVSDLTLFSEQQLDTSHLDGHANSISLKAKQIKDEHSFFYGKELVSQYARQIKIFGSHFESEQQVILNGSHFQAQKLKIISDQFYKIHITHEANISHSQLSAQNKGMIISESDSIKIIETILLSDSISAYASKQIALQSTETHTSNQTLFKANQITLDKTKFLSETSNLKFHSKELEFNDSFISAKNLHEKAEKLNQTNTSTRVFEKIIRYVSKINDINGSTQTQCIHEIAQQIIRMNHPLLAITQIQQNANDLKIYNSQMKSKKIIWNIENATGSNNHIDTLEWQVTAANNLHFSANTILSKIANIKANGIDLSLSKLEGNFILTNGHSPLDLTGAHLTGQLVATSDGEVNAALLFVNGEQFKLAAKDKIWAPQLEAQTVQKIAIGSLKEASVQLSILNSSEDIVTLEANGLYASKAYITSKGNNVLCGDNGPLVIDSAVIQSAAKTFLQGDYIDGSFSRIRTRALHISKRDLQAEVRSFGNADGTIELFGGTSEITVGSMITNPNSHLVGSGQLQIASSQNHFQNAPIEFRGRLQLNAPDITMQAPSTIETLILKATNQIHNRALTLGINLSFSSHEMNNTGSISGDLVSIHQQNYKRPGDVAAKVKLELTSNSSLNVNDPINIEGGLTLHSFEGPVRNNAPISNGGDLRITGTDIDILNPVNSGGRGIFNTPGATRISHTQVRLGNGIESKSKTFFSDVSDIDIIVRDALQPSSIQSENFVLGSESPSNYIGLNTRASYPHTPSNFRHVGELSLAAISAINDASNFLVKGKMKLEGADLINKNRSHLYTWTEQVDTHTSRRLFHKKSTPIYATRSQWITDGVANTQISEDLELHLSGTVRNDGVIAARRIHGQVGNLLNGIFGNVGRSPDNLPAIPFVGQPVQFRPGGEFRAFEDIDLRVNQLTHNTGFASADNKFTLRTKQLINEARLNTETEEVVRVKRFGKTAKDTVETDHLNPGGRIEGKKVLIYGVETKNIGGVIEGRDFLHLEAKRLENLALSLRSAVHLNSRKQSQLRSLDAYSVRTDFQPAQINSGGILTLDLEDDFQNIGSEVTGWGDTNVLTGNLSQKTLFSSYKSESSHGIKKGYDLHTINMQEGKIRSITGNLVVKARKSDIDIEGEIGSYMGDATLSAARSVNFQARTMSVENRVSGTTLTPTTATVQSTRFNTTRSSLPTFFAGRNGVVQAGNAINGEGLRENIGNDLTREAQSINLRGHKVEHYQHTKGKTLGVSFFGSNAIEAAHARKGTKKIIGSLLQEDPGLASVFNLAKSRDTADITMNATTAGATLWNESAQFAKAYNDGNLGTSLGQHFGLTNSKGEFDPSFTVRVGTFTQSRNWTETAPSVTTVGRNLLSNASQQRYTGSITRVGNNAEFNGDSITWESAQDTFSERGTSVGVSASFAPEGVVNVGADFAKSKSNGTTHLHSNVSVGNHLQVNARDSMTLRGANLEGNTVNAITNKAIIESVQDTSSSRNSSGSFSTAGNVAFSASKSKSKQVTEVSGIKAKTQGLLRANELDLIGAAIQNIQVDAKILRSQDIQNEDSSQSFNMNINARDIAKISENRTMANLLRLSDKEKASPSGVYQLGALSYRKESQKGTTRATISGANGSAYGVNTDFGMVNEKGKNKKMHWGAAIVVPNVNQMQKDRSEMNQAMSSFSDSLSNRPQVHFVDPRQNLGQNSRSEEEPSISIQPQQPEDFFAPENLESSNSIPQYSRDEIVSSFENEDTNSNPPAYTPLPFVDERPRNWEDLSITMHRNHMVERMADTILFNNMVNAVSSAIIYTTKKVCNVHPKMNGWCEKALHKTEDGIKKAYSWVPENARHEVEHDVRQRNRNIQRIALYNERQYKIPQGFTFNYYQNVDELALNFLVIQPFGKVCSHVLAKTFKVSKDGVKGLFPTSTVSEIERIPSVDNGMLFQYKNYLARDLSLTQRAAQPNLDYGYLFSVTNKPVTDFITGTLLTPPINKAIHSSHGFIHSAKHHLKEAIFADPVKHTILHHVSPESNKHDSFDKKPTGSGVLRFPAQNELTACLKKHPMTNDPYFTEKRINEVVAKSFANQEKVPLGIDLGVMLELNDLNEKLRLPAMRLKTIQLNLTTALKYCAKEK